MISLGFTHQCSLLVLQYKFEMGSKKMDKKTKIISSVLFFVVFGIVIGIIIKVTIQA